MNGYACLCHCWNKSLDSFCRRERVDLRQVQFTVELLQQELLMRGELGITARFYNAIMT